MADKKDCCDYHAAQSRIESASVVYSPRIAIDALAVANGLFVRESADLSEASQLSSAASLLVIAELLEKITVELVQLRGALSVRERKL